MISSNKLDLTLQGCERSLELQKRWTRMQGKAGDIVTDSRKMTDHGIRYMCRRP